jgi:hypothetical protein
MLSVEDVAREYHKHGYSTETVEPPEAMSLVCERCISGVTAGRQLRQRIACGHNSIIVEPLLFHPEKSLGLRN